MKKYMKRLLTQTGKDSSELFKETKQILAKELYSFKDIDSKVEIPKKAGVYIIFEKYKVAYVGLTHAEKGLYRRIYEEHYRGQSSFGKKLNLNKEKKKKILDAGFSYIYKEIRNRKKREILEHYMTSVLNPKYGFARDKNKKIKN